MVETMLEFMLGPFRQITNFYMDHLLISNSVVLSSYVATVFFKKKKVAN